jgi:succinate dehydrogenase / fumarate reductase, flavoprotein subunit
MELLERYRRINLNYANLWATMILPYARELYNLPQLARVITLGAPERNESRGAHYKPEFPARNDDEWLMPARSFFRPPSETGVRRHSSQPVEGYSV